MKILDCTLRDGGYYNDWDFDPRTVECYLTAMNRLPVDMIEVGYRSLPSKNYMGRFGYSPRFELEKLREQSKKRIAVMFNEKDIRVEDLPTVLDPVADKLTQITIAVMLFIDFKTASNPIINALGWVFLVFLIKEAVMIVGGLIMLLLNIRPGAAEFWGKAATVVFYVGMVIIIAIGPEVGALNDILGFQLPNVITGIIVVLCAVMTIAAFASYMPETFRQFKEYFDNKKAAKNSK